MRAAPNGPLADNPLRIAVSACRRQFTTVGVFSLFVNVLMLSTSIYMMQVFDRVLASRSTDTLLFLTLIAAGAVLAMALLEVARGKVLARSAMWIEHTVGPEAFARAVEAQLRGRPYRMEAMRDLAACRGFVASPAMTALYDVPWVPIYLGVVFLLDHTLGWLATGAAVALFLLTVVNEWGTVALLRRSSAAAIESQRRAESIVRNAEVIDSMGMMRAVARRWQEGVARAVPDQQRAADRAGWALGATKFVRLGAQIGVLGLGALLVLEQVMTPGAMIAASIIMGRALAPVEQMIGAWKQLVAARQSYRRLTAHLQAPRLRPPGLPLPEPTARLAADRVTYAFPGEPMATIKGVSFVLEPGESLAVIGPSAAGKTTLIRLLIGVLEPNAGTVRLGGANIYTWMREDLGRHIGYLPQDVELFDGTVLENIARMREPDAEAVFTAAQMAGCHEMILGLPKDYRTEIGDGGTFLSAGQRQMIGLARALYGGPKLVVLDEPNSNLDGDGESSLIRALAALKEQGTTVVLVSHRPALVQGVDKVMLLRNGSIEQLGPRTEVLKRLLRPTQVAGPAEPQRPDEQRVAQ